MKKQEQKKGRKFLLARAALLLFAVLFAHNSAWAQSQTVSTITTSENLFKSSTVYVGEVVVDGESRIKYLYSGDVSLKQEVITNLLSGLQGMADDSYATMLDGTEADEEASGLALCSDPELVAEMDENWSSAQQVGTLYFTGKSVASETNSNLYDIDEGFKAKLDELTEARTADIHEPLDAGNCIITHLDSRMVDDVYYTIEDGRVIRHYDTNIIYDSEKTTVIFTKVELVSSSDMTREFVDLGLTSGTLWATTNVGADNPQDIGLFFAWGDTEGHELEDGYLFSWENYKWGEVSGYDTYFTKYCSDSSRGKDGFTDGKAEVKVNLKHNEFVEVLNIPEGVTYTVVEDEDITHLDAPHGDDEDADAYMVEGEEEEDTEITVGERTEYEITNTKAIVPDTGISLESLPYVLMMALAVFGFVVLKLRKREEY